MKWRHYYPIFDRYLPAAPKAVLEIGVREGDGLRWLRRKYPSPETTVFGMDLDTSLVPRDGPWCLLDCNQSRIYPEVLERLGTLDAVIDDGGHRPYQQAASFRKLWPVLNGGGVYFLEDTHMGQRLHWRLYSKLFGIEPLLRRMERAMSRWEGPQASGWRSPMAVMRFPQLTVVVKGSVFVEEGDAP